MISVPSDADSPKFKTTVGYAKYIPENNHVVWHIKSFPVSIILPEKTLLSTSPSNPPPLVNNVNIVNIMISVPSDVDLSKFLRRQVGYVKYIPEHNHVVWHVKSFP